MSQDACTFVTVAIVILISAFTQTLTFRSNLQVFLSINDSFVLINHGLAGNLQPIVWSYYLVALPAILLGIFFGLRLDRRINPEVFRRLVQVLLIVMGLRLILL